MVNAKEITTQQKFKVMTKLYGAGFKSKSELLNLDIEQIIKIDGITIPEMTIIISIIKSVKKGKLYDYLGGGDCEQQDEA